MWVIKNGIEGKSLCKENEAAKYNKNNHKDSRELQGTWMFYQNLIDSYDECTLNRIKTRDEMEMIYNASIL